mgnify:CR=1 FL=1|jgi:hypothetical protein
MQGDLTPPLALVDVVSVVKDPPDDMLWLEEVLQVSVGLVLINLVVQSLTISTYFVFVL